jgi:hypothetical protein
MDGEVSNGIGGRRLWSPWVLEILLYFSVKMYAYRFLHKCTPPHLFVFLWNLITTWYIYLPPLCNILDSIASDFDDWNKDMMECAEQSQDTKFNANARPDTKGWDVWILTTIYWIWGSVRHTHASACCIVDICYSGKCVCHGGFQYLTRMW